MAVCKSDMKDDVSSAIKVTAQCSRTRFSLRRRCPPNLIDWAQQGANAKKNDKLGPLSITLPECFSDDSFLSSKISSDQAVGKGRMSVTLPTWSSSSLSDSLPDLSDDIDEDNNVTKFVLKPQAHSSPCTSRMPKKICAELVGKSMSKKRTCLDEDYQSDCNKKVCTDNQQVSPRLRRNRKISSDTDDQLSPRTKRNSNISDVEDNKVVCEKRVTRRDSLRSEQSERSLCESEVKQECCITPPLTPDGHDKDFDVSSIVISNDTTESESEFPAVDFKPKAKELQEGDIVFVKVRTLYWPCIVNHLYKKRQSIKKISVLSLNTTCKSGPIIQKFSRGYNKKQVLRYTWENKVKMTDEASATKHSDNYMESLQQVEDYLVHKSRYPRATWKDLISITYGLDADLTFDSSRINNFSYMSNFSEDSGESSSGEETVPGMDEDETENEEEIVTTENKSALCKTEEEEVDSDATDIDEPVASQLKDLPGDMKDDDLPGDLTRHDLEKAKRSKEHRKKQNSGLVNILMRQDTKEYLFAIYQGKIHSDLHNLYCKQYKTDKEQKELKYGQQYGPIDDEDQVDHMLNILHDYFKEVSSEPYSFYPVEVWYQEALIYCLMKRYKLTKKKAITKFKRGVDYSLSEQKVMQYKS